MAVFDQKSQRIVVTVVYDGPAYAGKTTNLEQLCEFFTEHRRSELFSTQNAGERTMFLDWLQLEGGVVAGEKLRCQLITVPGQTVLARRRWHLLKRADVLVFVLDSTPEGLKDAKPMFESVRKFIEKDGRDLPIVVQANKQDREDSLPTQRIANSLSVDAKNVVAAQAEIGVGVRETAVLAIRATADRVQKHVLAHGIASLVGEVSDGARIKEEIEEEERANPQSLLSIVMEHAPGQRDPAPPSQAPHAPSTGARPNDEARQAVPAARLAAPSEPPAVDEVPPTPRVVPVSGLPPSTPPPLPGSDAPSGCIWPATSGRDVLRRVPLAHATLQVEDIPVGSRFREQREGFLYEAGLWSLKTSRARRFEDFESARTALLLLARRKILLGAMLLKNTVLTLEPDRQGGHWLWTVAPGLSTLHTELVYAREHGDLHLLDEVLTQCADAAVASMKLAVRRSVVVDLHPNHFARTDSGLYYVHDQIAEGRQLPGLGTALLAPAQEYADFEPAVANYMKRLAASIKQELTGHEIADLGLRDELERAGFSNGQSMGVWLRMLQDVA